MTNPIDVSPIRDALAGKALLVIPYMHADWAWCHTREWHERRYVSIFEDVVARMKEGTGFKWYMDCFRTELVPVIERRPELIPEIRRFVDSGDIEICGGFANVRPNMVAEESYVRNMAIGREKFLSLFPGAQISVHAESVDVALGHPQIPQLLKKGGFRYYRAGRPYQVMEKKGLRHEFIWEGLDGSRVPVWWGEYGGMIWPEEVAAIQQKLPDWEELVRYLYEKELAQYTRNTGVDVMWVAQGCDDVLPLKAFNSDLDLPLPEIIEKWNQSETSMMRFACPSEFFHELERQTGRMKVHRGSVDICDVCYNVAWGGERGLAARRIEAGERIARAETCEALATMAGEPAPRDMRAFWEDSLTATAHATAWLFTQDFDDMYERMEGVLAGAKRRMDGALRALAGRIAQPEGAVAVAFNPSGADWGGVVSFTLPCGDINDLAMVDGLGMPLPHQIIRPLEYTDSVWEHEICVRVSVPALGYTTLCARGARTDCRLGGSFVRPAPPRELGDNEKWTMDNGALSLSFEGGRLLSILDLKTGRPLERGGESAYNDLVFTAIDTDKGILHAGPIEREVRVAWTRGELLEEGPVRWRARLYGSDGERAYVQTVSLEVGSRDVSFEVEVDWPVSRGYLCCAVPVTEDCALSGGIPFGVEPKDVDAEPYSGDGWEDMHRLWKGLFCAKDFARAKGAESSVSIVSLGGDRYYFFDRARCELKYVLINSARMIDGTWEDSVSRRSIESVGRHRFHYVVRVDNAGATDAQVAAAARARRHPPTLLQPFGRVGGPTLPAHGSLAKFDAPGAVLTALYVEGEDYMLRFFESEGRPVDARIAFGAKVTRCISENLIGEPDGRPVSIDENEILLRADAFEIATLRVGRKGGADA